MLVVDLYVFIIILFEILFLLDDLFIGNVLIIVMSLLMEGRLDIGELGGIVVYDLICWW